MQHITTTQAEHVVGLANEFLDSEYGAQLDGAAAADQISNTIVSARAAAESLLQAQPYANGYYVPLSQCNVEQFRDVAATLAGHVVLLPASLVEMADNELYPAMISPDSTSQHLRLHVAHTPYRQKLLHGTSVFLAAAGQSETAAMGQHIAGQRAGLDAEHFATLLTATARPAIAQDWRQGQHANHDLRQRTDSAVTTSLANTLLSANVMQTTVTISQAQIRRGAAYLLWHEGLRDAASGTPETAARPAALEIVQGLGFEAVQRSGQLDIVKELL